ncbi:MAG: 1-acyl-sn-glycerol-3-phosphate acyltransferase [Gammaproteobacteria bacterium]|nr:1-acyl-sn-glycerol-3-phosphate acyltransferase [Gammaproteobacteria bacterium]
MNKPFSGSYHSTEKKIHFLRKQFPSLFLWPNLLAIILRDNYIAKSGKYNEEAWVKTTIDTMHLMEKIGVKFHIENLDILEKQNQPCVFVSNHMSSLDSFLIPGLIQPLMNFTFVAKISLTKAPLFKHIVLSRDPIIVDRKNPKENFKTILEEGKKRLNNGTSILVFPQATRTEKFDPKQFNTIGVKLAKHAGVQAIPLALYTNVWKPGKILKDIGKIDPKKSVHASFGEPIDVEGTGKDAQAHIINFISKKLSLWGNRSA